jgi:hypothetical protein
MDPNEEIQSMFSDEKYSERHPEINRTKFQTVGHNAEDVFITIDWIPILYYLRRALIILQTSVDDLTGDSLTMIARYIVFESHLANYDYSFSSPGAISVAYDDIRANIERIQNVNEDEFRNIRFILEAEIALILGEESIIEVFNMEHYPDLK